MRKSTKVMLMGAVMGLGMAGVATAAPLVSLRLILTAANEPVADDSSQDTNSGVELPQIGGVYQIPAGSRFYVEVGAAITNSNLTGTQTARASVTRNKALGIGSLNANIITPSNLAVTPIGSGGNSGTWSPGGDTNDLTIDGYSGNFANVVDVNSDGIPDVAGTNFADTQSLTNINSTLLLSKIQYGANPADGGGIVGNDHGYPSMLQQGEYTAGANDLLANLTTVFLANNLYSDPGTGNSITSSANNAAGEVNANVPIHVVALPEPASIGLLGLVGLTFGRRNRRK